MAEGGAVGPHFVRFECKNRPGVPATLSRAFGIDGKKTGAIELGIWVRQKNIQLGEREGSEPGLVIDFLGVAAGAALSALARIAGAVAHCRPKQLDAGRSSGSPSRRAPKTRSCRSG